MRSSVGKESLGTELSREGNTRDPENSVCSINPTNFDGGQLKLHMNNGFESY